MNQKGTFVVTALSLMQLSACASAPRCSDTPEEQSTNLAPQGCLLAQRTQLAVIESLGELSNSDAAFAMNSHSGHKVSMAVDSSASLSSRTAQWLAYQSSLHDVLSQNENSRVAATGELDELIDKFIAKQAGSVDACHAKLIEAKHQLNQLHQHVHDLAMEVNATDHEVTALNSQVESKLKENDELNEKCSNELAEIEKKNQENLAMLDTYRNEMEEMKQIANPNVSMSIANRTIIGGLLQMGLRDMLQAQHFSEAVSLMQVGGTEMKRQPPESAINNAKSLFAPLHMAMVDVAQCMQTPKGNHRAASFQQKQDPTTTTTTFAMTRKNVLCEANDTVTVKVGASEKAVTPKRGLADNENSTVLCSSVNPNFAGSIWLTCDAGTISADVSMCVDSTSNATKCEQEKKMLVEVFVKVYVDLARLIHTFEEQTTTGYQAEKEAKEKQCDDLRKPLQDDTARISNKASEKIKDLEDLRPRLEDAIDAESKLREQVKKLGEECALLPDTTSDLNKVRDAIKALSLCPGLGDLTRGNLKIPKFIAYIDFNEDATKNNDVQIDRRMRSFCQSAYRDNYPGELVLPATVAELAQNTIHEMPLTNTAPKPLLGMCPQCDGDPDTADGTQHKSGHARVCWDPGANLTLATQRRNCGTPPFSVACVVITTA
jgi:archaellum component FlaC